MRWNGLLSIFCSMPDCGRTGSVTQFKTGAEGLCRSATRSVANACEGCGTGLPFGKSGLCSLDSHLMITIVNFLSRRYRSVLSSSMASIQINNLLNTNDLHLDPNETDKINSQEVINYYEAQFRVILQELVRSDLKKQKWMVKAFFRELVNYLHFHLIRWLNF